MNYVKKMCILRQIKQGFSGDGKTLSGLIKIEQYGKNLAVEVSIINFAPLVSGEYFCLLSDGKGKTEMLSLRGKSIFNILSDMDISAGFCGIVCYVKAEVVPIAYGINGNGAYDWRAILNKAMPPVFPSPQTGADSAIADGFTPFTEENEPTMYEMNGQFTAPTPTAAPTRPAPIANETADPAPNTQTQPSSTDTPAQSLPPLPPIEEIPFAELVEESANTQESAHAEEQSTEAPQNDAAQRNTPTNAPREGNDSGYDDERLAGENYFEEEERERVQSTQNSENAGTQSPTENAGAQAGTNATQNDDATGVLHPFATDPDGYYLSVKREIDDLFRRYPADNTLAATFQRSEWVRLRGSKEAPEFLVGALYEEGRVKYVCYALAAEEKDAPPKEIQGVCSFVPVSPLMGAEGFFVIFQSAATGECVKPTRA